MNVSSERKTVERATTTEQRLQRQKGDKTNRWSILSIMIAAERRKEIVHCS